MAAQNPSPPQPSISHTHFFLMVYLWLAQQERDYSESTIMELLVSQWLLKQSWVALWEGIAKIVLLINSY